MISERMCEMVVLALREGLQVDGPIAVESFNVRKVQTLFAVQ